VSIVDGALMRVWSLYQQSLSNEPLLILAVLVADAAAAGYRDRGWVWS
jgi:hypothetical protein